MPRKEKGLEWPLVAGVTPARKTKGWRRERSETIIYANETCAELEYISSIKVGRRISPSISRISRIIIIMGRRLVGLWKATAT